MRPTSLNSKMKKASAGGALDRSDMRVSNTRLVLAIARRHPVVSQVQLAHETGLSPASIVSIVRQLVTQRLLRRLEALPGGVGRPEVRLAFDSKAYRVLAIRIRPDEVACALMDLAGGIVSRRDESFSAASGPDGLAKLVRNQTAALLKEAGMPITNVLAAGVSSPGVVDHQTGRLVLSKHLDWQDVDLTGLLRRATGKPVHVDSEGHVLLLAEHRHGVAKGIDDVILVVNEAGIGAHLLVSGKLTRGHSGLAGELGQMRLWRENEIAAPTIESIASGIAMTTKWSGKSRGKSTTLNERLSALFQHANANDAQASIVVTQASRALGVAIAGLVNCMDPALVVLTGQTITQSGGLMTAQIRQSVEANVLQAAGRELRIEESTLGEAAAFLGAAELVYDHYLG